MKCEFIAEVEESYLLGELELTQMEQIERHLAGCPHCARRVGGYEEMLGRMFVALKPVAPPASSRQAILAVANRLTPPASPQKPAPAGRPTRRLRRWNFGPVYGLAASLLLLALSGLSLFMAAELQNANARHAEAQQLIELTSSPDSWVWTMSQPDKPNTPNSPRARMYARANSDLYLVTATNMPPPPPGYFYKVWYTHGSETEFAGGLAPQGNGNYSLKVRDPSRSGAKITACFINVEAKDSSDKQPSAPPFLQWKRV